MAQQRKFELKNPNSLTQDAFERESSYCGHCWRVISNKVYFGIRGRSRHIDGTCADRQDKIPDSWFDRRTDKPPSYDVLTAYWASSREAERH